MQHYKQMYKTPLHENLYRARVQWVFIAFKSNLSIPDDNEKVTAKTLIITGTVHSWHQKVEAGRMAWNTPGIWKVNNELAADYYYSLVD
jgi:hypothetical protein